MKDEGQGAIIIILSNSLIAVLIFSTLVEGELCEANNLSYRCYS